MNDYWLEILMPDNELMIWEHISPKQVLFLRNNYMQKGCKVRTGKHEPDGEKTLLDSFTKRVDDPK